MLSGSHWRGSARLVGCTDRLASFRSLCGMHPSVCRSTMAHSRSRRDPPDCQSTHIVTTWDLGVSSARCSLMECCALSRLVRRGRECVLDECSSVPVVACRSNGARRRNPLVGGSGGAQTFVCGESATHALARKIAPLVSFSARDAREPNPVAQSCHGPQKHIVCQEGARPQSQWPSQRVCGRRRAAGS
jgi:hypothetical protein